jgi:hypothetical protein
MYGLLTSGLAAGIYGEEKVYLYRRVFPLANRGREFVTSPKVMYSISGMQCIGVKYGRLCLGALLLKEEMETQDVLHGITAGSV